MHALTKAALAAAALMMASPVAAMTVENTSAASVAGAHYLRDGARLSGGSDGLSLQSSMIGGGLRTDGLMEFSGDGAGSYGYLTSAEPKARPKAFTADFQDELPIHRAPGTTVYYGAPRAQAATTPQGK